MASLLVRVKSRMFVRANRRIFGALDGQYVSLARGRSMDFDDLRAYVAGDEVKDIDWKATARFGSPLVRNYSANRQHELVLLVDTGRNLAARAASGEPKRDLAVLVAGVLGYLSLRHGDRVSLAYGDESGIYRLPAAGTEGQLERLLRRINSAPSVDGAQSDVAGLLQNALRVLKRRSIVVVVTDDGVMSKQIEDAAKRLQSRHELLWCTIGDADLVRGLGVNNRMTDIELDWAIPEFVRGNSTLLKEFDTAETVAIEFTRETLESLGISHVRVESSDAVVAAMLSMLGRRAHARR